MSCVSRPFPISGVEGPRALFKIIILYGENRKEKSQSEIKGYALSFLHP